MKKIFLILSFLAVSRTCFAQSQEAQQLLLNWEKLTQLKKILQNMYDGYKIVHKGYTTIKDISEGNFSLHKTFLDGLLEVSPAVRKYKRIADIINYQVKIVKEYKSAFNQFKDSRQFTIAEIEHSGQVHSNLFNQSVKSVDELAMVITAGRLRMGDDERLQAIDWIYNSITDQYSFLQEFNNQTAVLSVQREKDEMDIKLMRRIHGLE
jgi:cysteinyl-tRNA synthetase